MILDKIVESRKERIKVKKDNLSFEDLKTQVDNKLSFNIDSENNKNNKNNKNYYNYTSIYNYNLFEEKLKKNELSFICEVKKASPSKGLICEDFDPVKIAKEYENAGASAISVLTESEFFKGDDQYLFDIANSVNLPVLRKDFIIDEYMIYEAKLLGASALLLIVSILDEKTLKKFIDLTYRLDMCPLVEIHTKNELKIAINAGSKVIGLNNRNLKDFTVDIKNSLNLQRYIPKNMRNEIMFVSESGISTPEDIKILNDNEFDAVLIGESLMKSNNKKLTINNLKSLI